MATLFSFSKARQSHEPITLASSGVKIQQWTRPLILVGIFLTLITLSSLEWLQPWGETYKRDYLNEISTNLIKKQLKQNQTEFHFGNEDLYFYKNNQGTTSAIIQQKEDNQLSKEIFLSSTKLTIDDQKHEIILEPKGPVHIFNFNKEGDFGHGVIKGTKPQVISYPHEVRSKSSFKEMSLSKMYNLIQTGGHEEQLKLESYFHEKICIAFAPFLLIMVSIPIGFISKNTDHTKSFMLGLLLIFLIYYPSLIMVKKLAISGAGSIPILMQAPNFILIALAILGLRRLNSRI